MAEWVEQTQFPMNPRRDDLGQTSSGIGHQYRRAYYFPTSDFQRIIHAPMPDPLNVPDRVLNTQKHDATTTITHDYKHHQPVYMESIHKMAPGSRRVQYVKDHVEKLGSGGWKKPLTMANQVSEMHDNYRAQTALPRNGYPFERTFEKQGFMLQDHHINGPSLYGCATTQNPKLQGAPFYIRDKGVLRLMDPYISTTSNDHRSFTYQELKSYPTKNIATYWQCEDYPKAWGHGVQHNPLPKDTVPRERPPMRDNIWFKSATKVPRQPKSFVAVPHSGLKTLHAESFQSPADTKMRADRFCPVDTPYHLPKPGTKMIMTAPKMYVTEYQNVGSRTQITV